MGIQDYINSLPASILNNLPGDILLRNEFYPSNRNRLTGNKFLFVLTRTPNLTYFCQRANIPEISMGVSLQSNPTAMDIKRPGTRHIFGDLSVAFSVDEEMRNWLEIYSWIRDLSVDTYPYKDILPEHQKVSGAMMYVLSSSYKPILNVQFYDVFPISLTGIDFDSTAPDTQYVQAVATFSFVRYEIHTIAENIGYTGSYSPS
jgi:hypothetical protein